MSAYAHDEKEQVLSAGSVVVHKLRDGDFIIECDGASVLIKASLMEEILLAVILEIS